MSRSKIEKNQNETSQKMLPQSLQTTLCYIEKDNKYLMLHRIKKENDVNKDKWIGIGGKFEEGESPNECNCREVYEETGLKLNNPEYRGIVTFVNKQNGNLYCEYMHLFWCNDFSGIIKECDEGFLEWIPKDKMNDLPHWEGDEIFLKLLDSTKNFFSLKLIYSEGKLVESVLY